MKEQIMEILADHLYVENGNWVAGVEEAAKLVEEKFKSTNTGSPKCYCCGSENVIIECGSCKERRVFGTWSAQ